MTQPLSEHARLVLRTMAHDAGRPWTIYGAATQRALPELVARELLVRLRRSRRGTLCRLTNAGRLAAGELAVTP